MVDIAAKGGNLLLNVGPRGEDATIADAQLRRLDWLGAFTSTLGEGLFATRPWISPGETTGGTEVRYLARDDVVFAFARRETGAPSAASAPSIVLREVRATPTTTVSSLDGVRLRSESTPEGLEVWLAEPLGSDVPQAVAIRPADAAQSAAVAGGSSSSPS